MTAEKAPTITEREFYMRRRQALIIELGAIEDRLGMDRSILPKHKKKAIHLDTPKKKD